MVNNDLRTGSFIIKQKITLRSLSNSNNSFTVQPIRKDVKNNEANIPHNKGIPTLNKNFKHFFDELTTLENFEEDYLNIFKNKKAKSLYKVIEGKILRSKILKDCKELKDLFGKKSTQEIDNLAKLIDLCGKADQLDIDYDLKSKLREIISEVLFKTNNSK